MLMRRLTHENDERFFVNCFLLFQTHRRQEISERLETIQKRATFSLFSPLRKDLQERLLSSPSWILNNKMHCVL